MVRLSNLLILLVFALVISFGNPALAAKKKKSSSNEANKYASIVIDASTGAILSQSNPDKVLHPASLTKIMTLMLTFEAIDKGQLRMSDRIAVSSHAASMSPSKLGLRPGETIKVQDAIYAVVTKSANDISVALAEAVGGSEDNFVHLMNVRAQAVGMTRTRFRNASGLPDAKQVSTARDMAKLARYVITTHAKYYPVFNTRNFTYKGRNYHNHNRLMETYAGMDGMKTGYVNASGFNLVASAKRNNQRLIAVVFGGRTAASRNLHMAGLLDKGFDASTKIRMARKDVPALVQASAHDDDASRLIIDTADASSTRVLTTTTEGRVTAGDRLIETAPQISSFAQTRSQAAQKAQNLGTVRVASLSSTTDAQPTFAPRSQAAPLDIKPLYIPRQNAAVPAMPAGYASSGTWSVQVGAYQNRTATDQALYKAIHKLPPHLSSRAQAMIVPLRTAEASWVFRARLSGFTSQAEAAQACAILKDCLTISPQAY